MDKDKALERLNKAFDYLKDNGQALNQPDMATLMGIRQPHLEAAINGDYRRLTEGLLKKIATAYSEYNGEDLLILGEGETVVHDRSKPHYDTKASAGFKDGLSEEKMLAEFREMAVPLKAYDFSLDVEGNSKLPKIEHGDMLKCRVSVDRFNPPIGKICILNTKEGWKAKVKERVNEDTITLHSLNLPYYDYDIDYSSILSVAEVDGLVRSFN